MTALRLLALGVCLLLPAFALAQAEDGAEPPTPERAASVSAMAGIGVGTLSFERPTEAGVQRLPQTPFAAAEFQLRAALEPAKDLSLAFLLSYQTSFGMVLRTPPLFGLPQDVHARSQRIELSVAPAYRLSEALSLGCAAGFVLRTLRPDVHQFDLADYAIAGPVLRPELTIDLGERLALRVGPELQWLPILDSSLRDEGACCQGLGVGGQAAVEARLSTFWIAGLAYRETHVFVPPGTFVFQETERFATARIGGSF